MYDSDALGLHEQPVVDGDRLRMGNRNPNGRRRSIHDENERDQQTDDDRQQHGRIDESEPPPRATSARQPHIR